ncbi:hypothetical protein QN277_025779 [Acacia crassicarpa]|uniref:Uncharacterized protein n=1 Tax=Acacia crassicarpa TaxID=499986 RepID=A0AAE1ML95_9FABA|nr:hypothetical protein QN277_025779 [Acacia crassicarpa]
MVASLITDNETDPSWERSPAFVANNTYTITSFALVLEFNKGRLQNLYWNRDGCAKCSGNSNFVCLNSPDYALKTTSCKGQGGTVDCSRDTNDIF